MRFAGFRKALTVLLVVAAGLLWHETVLARGVSSPFGIWPENWPEELEPFRERAESEGWGVIPGVVTQNHIIEFETREEFEGVWPAILRLKSKGAPLTLKTPDKPKTDPNDRRIFYDKPQVWIVCPPPDDETRYEVLPDGTYTLVAPWTNDLELSGGALPRHAVKRKDGKWVAWDGEDTFDDYEEPARILQARVELTLFVDGEVVDLNRIRLPEDTAIVDNRSEEAYANLATDNRTDDPNAPAAFRKTAQRVYDLAWDPYEERVSDAFTPAELDTLSRHLPSLQSMIETGLGLHDSVWGAKLAGHFRLDKTLPLLRSRFLTPRRCYGWEGPDYSKPESYLMDGQYQYSITYLEAIEAITGKTITTAINLTQAESEEIEKYAGDGSSQFHHWALWMQKKLEMKERPNQPIDHD